MAEVTVQGQPLQVEMKGLVEVDAAGNSQPLEGFAVFPEETIIEALNRYAKEKGITLMYNCDCARNG